MTDEFNQMVDDIEKVVRRASMESDIAIYETIAALEIVKARLTHELMDHGQWEDETA